MATPQSIADVPSVCCFVMSSVLQEYSVNAPIRLAYNVGRIPVDLDPSHLFTILLFTVYCAGAWLGTAYLFLVTACTAPCN